MNTSYEAVIGLEVHVELKTDTKIFCSCSNGFSREPNTNVCPICLGLPGALPMLGEKSVEYALRAGIAFGCKINKKSWFDRKNYHYPDLPKGYQITQYEMPICLGGEVPIDVGGEKKSIRLTRIHMEEDAGKLIHRGDKSLIDYNRAGVPLIEIVSEPDMRTPEEAKAYLNSLRRILLFIGVSDCKMNEGSLRCDVNVSVRRKGEAEFGTKVEIKNLNSVNYVGRALDDEIKRQIALIERGEIVDAETRRYNEDTDHTERMRKKEGAVDYRYFTEPNIPPLILTDSYIEEVRRRMPRLPDEEADALVKEIGVKKEDAYLLTSTSFILDYFKKCAEKSKNKSICANLFISEVLTLLDENSKKEYISPENFGEIADMFADGKIVSGVAKRLVKMSAESGESPVVIAERERLLKISDEKVLRPIVLKAIDANPKAVSDYLGGKIAAAKQLMGAVMRESGGGADPIISEKLILEELEKIKNKI
ncbi:MAG: Asp-tRNA(Asn)/Glu-tRNA(Gln) amidotransferase subunit GatB [Ruminococcaceae bacterium]|nr:Asp-tRNA(Asn)/Glu-tRNA(Gln) amidotransferase subunit GatB [Oscillospiraceae bacterium]